MVASLWTAARASLPACWQAAIGKEFEAPYMRNLAAFISAERAAGKRVFLQDALTFAALQQTPLDRVKAVILGQNPYHRPGQAMGLSFSVPPDAPVPPSLRNIHQELTADIGAATPSHGCLTAWADQGVLLLNTWLSVIEGEAGSHARAGGGCFTNCVLRAVNAQEAPVAFILWGKHAQKNAPMLNSARHLVHMSAHPSPLSAYRGFFGSRPFSRTNEFLRSRGVNQFVDWNLTQRTA
jgi:uracil-DNA glycosylase